jgi:hypothetical protein
MNQINQKRRKRIIIWNMLRSFMKGIFTMDKRRMGRDMGKGSTFIKQGKFMKVNSKMEK